MGDLRAFELLHAVAQLVDLSRHRRQCLGERIVNLFGIGNHNSFSVTKDDMPRNSDHGRIFRHAAQYDRTRADPAIASNRDVAENFRSVANHHVIFDRGMSLTVLLSSAAKSDSLIQSHVVADDRGLADHHTNAMIDEKSSANFGSGMDFDSSKEARHLRKPSP